MYGCVCVGIGDRFGISLGGIAVRGIGLRGIAVHVADLSLRIDMHIDMCIDIFMDMCIDMFMDMQ